MYNVSLYNNKKDKSVEYHLFDTWQDITISQFKKIYEVIKTIPKDLLELWRMQSDNDDKLHEHLDKLYSNRSIDKIFPLWYIKVFEVMSDIPKEILLKLPYTSASRDMISITTLFEFKLRPIIQDSLYHIPEYTFEPTTDESFVFKGERYYYPKTEMIFDKPKHFSDVTIHEFAEARDLYLAQGNDELADLKVAGYNLSNYKYDYITEIMAILCRPKGEKYDENKMFERSKIFMDLPMSHVWQLFFCFCIPCTIYLQDLTVSALEDQIKELSQTPPPQTLFTKLRKLGFMAALSRQRN